MLEEPDYIKGIDRLKFSCGMSFAIFAFASILPKDGSSFGEFAANTQSIFGLLTVVLVLVLMRRSALQ